MSVFMDVQLCLLRSQRARGIMIVATHTIELYHKSKEETMPIFITFFFFVAWPTNDEQ